MFARHKQAKKFRTPIDLLIDECHLILSEDLKTILSEARKFGLHLTLASQHVGQDMTTTLKNTVLTNTMVKVLGGQARVNRRLLAPYFHLKEELIPRLKRGQFLARTSKGNQLFDLPTRYLANRQEVSSSTWAKVKTEQLRLFYEPSDQSKTCQFQKTPLTNHTSLANTKRRKRGHTNPNQLSLPVDGPKYR